MSAQEISSILLPYRCPGAMTLQQASAVTQTAILPVYSLFLSDFTAGFQWLSPELFAFAAIVDNTALRYPDP